MLPQFGYIVAQAGADSRPPPQGLYDHKRTTSSSSPQQNHQQQQQKGTTLNNGKESRLYYNAPPPTAPRSPNHGPLSMHQKVTGTSSMSLPPTAYSLTAPSPKYQSSNNGTSYMYSTTTAPTMPPSLASSKVEHKDYGGYHYDRMNTQETQPAMTANGQSFRPLQQAPPSSNTKTSYSWQQPNAYMDYSYNVSSSENGISAPASSSYVWHNTPPNYTAQSSFIQPSTTKNYSTHDNYQSPPPPPPSMSNQYDYVMAPPPVDDIIVKQDNAPIYDYTKTPRWAKETTSEVAEPKILRRLREYNYLMNWMDNEYWEQNDEMYQEKIQYLQKELKNIQEGDHAVFQELVTDLEIIRDQTIESALCFENYQLTMTKQDYDMDVMMIEEEFKSDSQHLSEVILLVIDEHRKQIKDDRDDTDQLDIDGIFQEAFNRIQQKRNLRKRTIQQGDRPALPRPETSSRGRRLKNPTVAPHNINAPMTSKEEDDIEFEYMTMKGGLSKRTGGPSRR